jgi:hypothetical protein
MYFLKGSSRKERNFGVATNNSRYRLFTDLISTATSMLLMVPSLFPNPVMLISIATPFLQA